MATFQEICVIISCMVLVSSVSVGVSGFCVSTTASTPAKIVVSPSQQQQQQQRHTSTTRYEGSKKKTKNKLLILQASDNNNDNDNDNGDGSNDNKSDKVETLKDQRAQMSSKISNDRIEFPPNILDPFPQAADPTYATTAPVGQDQFVVSRRGGPTSEELTNDNILLIVERRSNVTDLEVNTLVWKCLGYRFYPSSSDDNDDEDISSGSGSSGGGEWRPDEVFPNWKERFPEPPDLIGMQRIYSKEVDSTSLKNNQHLVRSVPDEFKQSLKGNLKPLGFTGYKVSELTPNLTRRAQCANWLLYYRDELFGYTLDELKERRQKNKKQQQPEEEQSGSLSSQDQTPPNEEKKKKQDRQQQKDWKPPVKEVF